MKKREIGFVITKFLKIQRIASNRMILLLLVAEVLHDYSPQTKSIFCILKKSVKKCRFFKNRTFYRYIIFHIFSPVIYCHLLMRCRIRNNNFQLCNHLHNCLFRQTKKFKRFHQILHRTSRPNSRHNCAPAFYSKISIRLPIRQRSLGNS